MSPWSETLERSRSLHLLLLSWRLRNLTLSLTQTVRVEKALEVVLHLLQELLPEMLEIGLARLAATAAATATPPVPTVVPVVTIIRANAHVLTEQRKISQLRDQLMDCAQCTVPTLEKEASDLSLAIGEFYLGGPDLPQSNEDKTRLHRRLTSSS